jgi:hypothetical protein
LNIQELKVHVTPFNIPTHDLVPAVHDTVTVPVGDTFGSVFAGSVKTTFEGEEAKILSVEMELEVGLKGLEYSSQVHTVCTAKT